MYYSMCGIVARDIWMSAIPGSVRVTACASCRNRTNVRTSRRSRNADAAMWSAVPHAPSPPPFAPVPRATSRHGLARECSPRTTVPRNSPQPDASIPPATLRSWSCQCRLRIRHPRHLIRPQPTLRTFDRTDVQHDENRLRRDLTRDAVSIRRSIGEARLQPLVNVRNGQGSKGGNGITRRPRCRTAAPPHTPTSRASLAYSPAARFPSPLPVAAAAMLPAHRPTPPRCR